MVSPKHIKEDFPFNSELIHLFAIPGGGGPPPDPPPFIEMPSCLWEHMVNPKDIRGGFKHIKEDFPFTSKHM